MLWRTRDVIYSTEHHQREDIARYCSAHFGETINQERKLQDATRNRKVVKIRDSICQTWQEQRYKYNVTLLVKLHLLLIRFFSFCLLSPKKDDKTFPEIVIPSRDVQTLSFGLWQFLPTCSLEHHQLQGHSYKCQCRSEFYNINHRLQNDCKQCQGINLQFLWLVLYVMHQEISVSILNVQRSWCTCMMWKYRYEVKAIISFIMFLDYLSIIQGYSFFVDWLA